MIKTRYPLRLVILSFLLPTVVCYGYNDDLRLRTSEWVSSFNWGKHYLLTYLKE